MSDDLLGKVIAFRDFLVNRRQEYRVLARGKPGTISLSTADKQTAGEIASELTYAINEIDIRVLRGTPHRERMEKA